MQNPKPLFVVLEGIDGAGTTTQTRLLVETLQSLKRTALATREPSTGPVGRLLREILLGQHGLPTGGALEGDTMALLFAADRVDHLQREISPALASGCDVVSDRYLMSSLAYQAEESNQGWVAGLARNVRMPDLTILLDVPVAVAAERRRRAGRPTERYDEDGLQARIAKNYRALAAGDRTAIVLDGTPGPEEVLANIMAELTRRFGPLEPG